jgi:beta-galactosidase
VATETASALASRGSYDLPADSVRLWPADGKTPYAKGNADLSVSAYDHVYAYWGSSHEAALKAVNKYRFMSGMFVWSGFDFLGEPVPYPWPARSSYYGIIDLAGFPKDVYYLYKSQWTTKPVLHLLPHWNWQPGDTVDVWAYYNMADEVELFLNGRSLGLSRHGPDQLHASWRVAYEPGTLRVVSRRNGSKVLEREVRTAGAPARMMLAANKVKMQANGTDMIFVTVRLEDSKGNLVPNADRLMQCTVSGAAILAGTDNGFQADTLSLKSNIRKTWKGLLLAMVQSNGKPGKIVLRAQSPGFKDSEIVLRSE